MTRTGAAVAPAPAHGYVALPEGWERVSAGGPGPSQSASPRWPSSWRSSAWRRECPRHSSWWSAPSRLRRGLDLASHRAAVVGTIPSGLPGLHVPAVSAEDILELLPAALGIFLMCFADEVLTARSFAGKHGQHIAVAQELPAMGAAQVAAGMSQDLPVGASGSRTAGRPTAWS